MKAIETRYFSILNLAVLFALCGPDKYIAKGNTMDDSKQYKIRIIAGDTILTATLYDNPATRDFIALLPLDLTLEDYAGTEKVSNLPKKLSTEDAPSGFDPSVGELTYYAPWGNLAIFYKGFGYASGLVSLGKIEQGMEVLTQSRSVNVRMELSEKRKIK